MTSIRAETSDDYAAIDWLNDAAFGQPGEGRLVRALRSKPNFDAGLSLVAETGARIVGHILFSPNRIERDDDGFDALSLAPMSVLPEFQNQGIGSQLVRRGLDACRRAGHRIVIVVGHVIYYPRFGFTPAAEHGILPPFDVPPEAFMVLELQPGSLRGVHGTVRYPPPFSQV